MIEKESIWKAFRYVCGSDYKKKQEDTVLNEMTKPVMNSITCETVLMYRVGHLIF